jgi:hypothetical protein
MHKALLLIIVVSFAKYVYTQTELNVPKYRIYPSSVTQTEPVAVVHPLNNQLLFVSAVTLNTANAFKSEGVYVSTNGGLNWSGSDTCNGALIFNHGGDPGIAITESGRFVLSHIGDIFPGVYTHYSTNLGVNWSAAFTVTNTQTGDKGTMAIDNSSQSSFKGRIYLTWTDLVNLSPTVCSFTTNEGESWNTPQVLNPNPPSRCVGGSVATSNDGSVYVCWSGITTNPPFKEDYAGFAASSDGGDNWVTQQNIFDMNGISGTLASKEGIKVNGLPQVAVDNSGGIREGWIYIVTTEFDNPPAGSDPDILLHRSTDGGVTWSAGIRVNQDPLNDGKIQYFPSLEIDDEGVLNILFYDDRNTTSDSTDVFLTRSIDGGNTWVEYSINNTRFKPKPIVGGASAYQGDHIALLSVGDKLYALWMADYSGIYQVWLAVVDRNALSVEDRLDLPLSSYTLFQNYPNPFNPSTKIRYVIEKESAVQLKIYDVLGNDIATLVSEVKPAGVYEVTFDASKLPSGIYFYKLTADGFSETKKLILLK